MDEKVRFVAAMMEEQGNVSELCERFGISRKTGYKWLGRYAQCGAEGLRERSHAPHRVPWAVSKAQAEAILRLRGEHPSWGPKKLRAKLCMRVPEQDWRRRAPSVSCSSARD